MLGRRVLLVGGLIVARASAAPALADESFPAVDPKSYCRMIMNSNPASWSDPGLFQSCIDTDLEGKEEAQSRWRAAAPEVREQCTELGKLQGHYSYQMILGCIRYVEQRV
jgi:hypothetical protein